MVTETSISYFEHGKIDKKRWNNLIDKAANGLIYAQSDYLDAMSPGWDALIYNDYEAIMPLTWRKKLGLRYLCQPAFCQQLGVFSTTPLESAMVEKFLIKISAHFRLIEIFVNYGNVSNLNLVASTNYLLSLKPGYESIKGNYRKDLVKNLARAAKYPFVYKATSRVDVAISQYRELYGGRMGIRPVDYESFAGLCKKWVLEDKCFVREVHLEEKNNSELMAIGIFLKDQNRIYNIASSTLPNGRTLEANHFLFDQIIREYAGHDLKLDFEGSDLPGVARFYQKFNPENQPYFFWKSNRLPAVLRWWKRG
jgi:hypothetical protein